MMRREESYMMVAMLAAAILATFAAPSPANATSLSVPDEAPSIQSALNASVDTVLIRPGKYAETPIVSRPGILLMGASVDSSDLPTIAGLRIEIYSSALYPAVYAFQSLRFVGRVVYLNDRNNADLGFAQCHLAGGIVDSSGFGDTGNITFSKCHLDSLMDLIAKGRIGLDSCQVRGHLIASGSPSLVEVRGCAFQADGDSRNRTAINSDGHNACNVDGNTIRNYRTGVTARGDQTTISNNLIEDCVFRGIYADHPNVTVANNTVRRCSYGIYVQSDFGHVIANTVVDVGNNGLDLGEAPDVEVVGNVFWRCGGNGMVVANGYRQSVTVRQNTSCFNGLSGYAVDSYSRFGEEWTGNIGYGNGRYGISWLRVDAATMVCNDWFGNRLGSVEGRPPSSNDLSVDPQFCDADGGDFRLNSLSSLVDWPSCGQVGALGVGCGVTATLVERFTATRASDGIRVNWEVAEGATASEIWLERSEEMEGGAWIRPPTDRSFENRGVAELDRSALADRSYWYRLVALEVNDATVIGSPIVVEAQARLDSRLVEVGPSPSGGPVRIAFALNHAAAIEVDVFDLQGRKVASLGRGVWPAGTHEVVWDGRTRNGQSAPAGMYVVRYLYPGGQDRRGIVRIR